MSTALEARYFSGAALFGDDLDEAGIRQWYAGEEHGYFELASNYDSHVYAYDALNEFHAYRFLHEHYNCCVALGCANGDDVAPLADRVDQFVAIEPAERWWSRSIGGRPANYLKPSVFGDIPMADGSADLVTSIGVLHHLPNVSHVFSEMVRVLRPGGTMVVREPISTMGDWRQRRPGLTRNERGFPPGWLEARGQDHGLVIRRAAHCLFPLTGRLARLFRYQGAYNSRLLVRFDALTSWLMSWNLHYHRDSLFKKIAPGDVYLVLEKAARPLAHSVAVHVEQL